MTSARPFLMGSETEYAVSGRGPEGTVEATTLFDLLCEVLRKERRTVGNDCSERGLFLENAARFYLDYGGHPEWCTAECPTPAEVACQDKAGEHLLALARDEVQRARPGLRLTLLKNNLDPVWPDRITYGTHESYTSWVPAQQAAAALMAHLVTRTLYAGAGALTGHANSPGFELSQRARHLTQTFSCDTTDDRPIFCTRIRNERDYHENGWTRLHLIAKDSQRAPLGIYLTFATTGLLVEMLNRGLPVGKGLTLSDPVRCLHEVSRDPWLGRQLPLADGRRLTALQVQACYLEECAQALQRGGLPEWAGDAVRHWRQTLADLERDPMRLADRLDPYCKLFLYEHELKRAQYSWADLQRAVARLQQLRMQFTAQVVTAVLADDPGKLDAKSQEEFGRARDLAGTRDPGNLDRLRFALRLQALDLHYHEVGGLYDRLAATGHMRPVILGPEDVERASREPPSAGRARARGAAVRDNREPGWLADWHYLWHPATGRCLDLRDPFSSEGKLLQVNPVDEDDYFDIEDYFATLTATASPQGV